MTGSGGVATKQILPAMRTMFVVSAGLVLIMGTILYGWPGETDRLFAWTIASPLTAATIGASYLSACGLELAAVSRDAWSRARVAGLGVWLFTLLTLAATLIHHDRFHFDSGEMTAKAFAWVWLGVYVSVPVALGAALVRQHTAAGVDEAGGPRLSRFSRTTFGVLGAGMAVYGLAIAVSPSTAVQVWPWPLTDLTARALAAWMVGLGVVSIHTALEDAIENSVPMVAAAVPWVALVLLALVRFRDEPDWGSPSVWIYVATIVALGAAAADTAVRLYEARRCPSSSLRTSHGKR